MTRLTTETDHDSAAALAREPALFPALVLVPSPRGPEAPIVRYAARFPVELGRGGGLLEGVEDTKISRSHARIEGGDGRWKLVDLGSRNGTWLQGRRIVGETPLHLDEIIRVGDTLMVFAGCLDSGYHDDEPIGIAASSAAVRRALPGLAVGSASVLITGETGTGKEVLARAIHDGSGRRGRLVAINCGAMPEALLASELFGHTRGSFSGATEAREGLFRQADGGTLFLDEIGEMPAPFQVHLLRALETRLVRPVGASRDIPVDVRVLAATHRDLPTAIQQGFFRADLYARLAQRQISLSPLRERRADLPFLIHHFLRRLGASGRFLSLPLAHRLLLHSWPLNARSLLNLLATAHQACPAGAPLDLTPEIERMLRDEASLRPPAALAPGEPAARSSPPELSRSALEALLLRYRGRVADVSRHLGCKRQTLYEWLAHHNLEPDDFRGHPR